MPGRRLIPSIFSLTAVCVRSSPANSSANSSVRPAPESPRSPGTGCRSPLAERCRSRNADPSAAIPFCPASRRCRPPFLTGTTTPDFIRRTVFAGGTGTETPVSLNVCQSLTIVPPITPVAVFPSRSAHCALREIDADRCTFLHISADLDTPRTNRWRFGSAPAHPFPSQHSLPAGGFPPAEHSWPGRRFLRSPRQQPSRPAA